MPRSFLYELGQTDHLLSQLGIIYEMVEKKSKESQAEIAHLKEAMQLDGREREARIKQTQQQLAQWDNIGNYAKQVMEQIEALKKQPGELVKA